MSETYKISGQRFALPKGPKGEGWTFEKRPGGWIIATSHEGKRKRLALHELRGKLGVALNGSLYFGSLEKKSRTAAQDAGGSDSDLIAQFPGKVRKLLVADGAQVKAGEPLILLEAMKMEFTVRAPFAGTVLRALVTEGQQLVPGDRFFEITPS
jgi:acetyl/propionyl-CoA carboxylase alpha subunit